MGKEAFIKGQSVSCAAYHAFKQPAQLDVVAIIALLPLFFEYAETPAMVKHGMNMMMNLTHSMNRDQIQVLDCDWPIFAMCKYIQFIWSAIHGEEKTGIMFRGLHLENGFWNTLGDFLDSSG